MSSAPKTNGVNGRIVFCLLAGSAMVVLGCGPSETPVNTRPGARPKTFKEDAVLKPTDAAEGFLGMISDEEYGQALKKYSTIGFQGRYNSISLKEVIERDGRGLVGWKQRDPLASVSQTQDSKTYRTEVGGGRFGSAKCEITVSNEESGWRVSEFVVLKK